MKFFFLFFIILSLAVIAQDSAKYNFGSMQPAKEISVAPGGEYSTKLYFYNIYGNRITHLSLESDSDVLEISIEPKIHETEVMISGIPSVVEENLFIRPSSPFNITPKSVPEGKEIISSSVGMIEADYATITVYVPDDASLGAQYSFTINADARWLGQDGSVAISQSRSFDYTVLVKSDTFEEVIIEAPDAAQNDAANSPRIPTGNVVADVESSGSIIIPLFAVIIALLFVLIIVIIKK